MKMSLSWVLPYNWHISLIKVMRKASAYYVSRGGTEFGIEPLTDMVVTLSISRMHNCPAAFHQVCLILCFPTIFAMLFCY